jgi:5-hydroxyisourate hydrolase
MSNVVYAPDLSTHILDISLGLPAKNVLVKLYKKGEEIASAKTDNDGRIKIWFSSETGEKLELVPKEFSKKEIYSLTFFTGDYFEEQKIESIYPKVQVEFKIDEGIHYHIPILLSPFGYSTYRGS